MIYITNKVGNTNKRKFPLVNVRNHVLKYLRTAHKTIILVVDTASQSFHIFLHRDHITSSSWCLLDNLLSLHYSVLHLGLVDSELNGLSSRLGSKIVHASLQALLPAVEMHGTHLTKVWLGNVNIEGRRLVNESSSLSSLSNDDLLRDLPDSLYNALMSAGMQA